MTKSQYILKLESMIERTIQTETWELGDKERAITELAETYRAARRIYAGMDGPR
jgi:hypothetical protein